MKYKIIEDCSPFYIVFTHDGLDEFVEKAKQCVPRLGRIGKAEQDQIAGQMIHYNLAWDHRDVSNKLLEQTPISQDLKIRDSRVSYFVSGPGLYYRAHKDGIADRYSINYPLVVNDDKCITSWYEEEELKIYDIKDLPSHVRSRECEGWDRSKHTPIKSMTAREGTCILFNVDIFHDWDNSKSDSHRVILTLRHEFPEGDFYFEDARKALFGY